MGLWLGQCRGARSVTPPDVPSALRAGRRDQPTGAEYAQRLLNPLVPAIRAQVQCPAGLLRHRDQIV